MSISWWQTSWQVHAIRLKSSYHDFQSTSSETTILTPEETPVPLDKVGVLRPDRVAGLPDPDRLQHARVAQLLEHDGHVELHRGLVVVRLDAPNVERVAVGDGLQELERNAKGVTTYSEDS